MHSAEGKLHDIKERMQADSYHGFMDNNAREAHHLTIQDLKAIETVSETASFAGRCTVSYFILFLF